MYHHTCSVLHVSSHLLCAPMWHHCSHVPATPDSLPRFACSPSRPLVRLPKPSPSLLPGGLPRPGKLQQLHPDITYLNHLLVSPCVGPLCTCLHHIISLSTSVAGKQPESLTQQPHSGSDSDEIHEMSFNFVYLAVHVGCGHDAAYCPQLYVYNLKDGGLGRAPCLGACSPPGALRMRRLHVRTSGRATGLWPPAARKPRFKCACIQGPWDGSWAGNNPA